MAIVGREDWRGEMRSTKDLGRVTRALNAEKIERESPEKSRLPASTLGSR
jgi:hypothetical protein